MQINKLWVFQDESGEPGKSDFFLTGYIVITSEEKKRLLERISEIRRNENFNDEFHYNTFSDFRCRVYKRVIDITLQHNILFKCIVIRRNLIKLSFFGNKRHRAYNYFTKLVIYHGIKHRNSKHVHIRVDDKSRLKQDNFLTYLQDSLNYESITRGNGFRIRSVKPLSSRTCEMLQLTDLLLGASKCKFEPAESSRKNDFSNFVLNHQLRNKINIWDWRPY